MILRAKCIETLVLTGIATSGPRSLHRALRGRRRYKIVVVKDCCADGDDEVHRVLTRKSCALTHVQRRRAHSRFDHDAASSLSSIDVGILVIERARRGNESTQRRNALGRCGECRVEVPRRSAPRAAHALDLNGAAYAIRSAMSSLSSHRKSSVRPLAQKGSARFAT